MALDLKLKIRIDGKLMEAIFKVSEDRQSGVLLPHESIAVLEKIFDKAEIVFEDGVILWRFKK